MKRKIIITKDGSTTIEIEGWAEHYHSTHGAIQEAYHIFIKNGLYLFENQNDISILEIGLGTGLNAFITFLETENRDKIIHYQGVEAYPITIEEALAMNYVKELKQEKKSFIFDKIHTSSWDEWNTLSEHFFLKKRKQFFNEIIDENSFDLIYFDAFGARVQPELWTEEIFQKMYNALKINGKLVTYSSKGSARRAMQAVGFSVEKIPGPLGKREMLRATKI